MRGWNHMLAGNPKDLTVDGCGAVVRKVRLERGLALAEVANRMGWEQSRLEKHEDDLVGMDVETMRAIAAGLGITPEALQRRILREFRPQILANPIGAALKPLIDREL